MYTMFTIDGPIHSTDASEAAGVYRRAVDAGAHPSVWHGKEIVVHITQCQACAAPLFMTHTEVSDWVDVDGQLAAVLCERCRGPWPPYDRDPAWHRHLEWMHGRRDVQV